MSKTAQLLALAEAATKGPWHHCQPFKTVGKINTIHGPVPKTRVDFVSYEKEPVHKTVIIPMEGRESHVASINMAFIAAANPETIKQLVKLVRLQHEALVETTALCTNYESVEEDDGYKFTEAPAVIKQGNEAIEAFNKWESK